MYIDTWREYKFDKMCLNQSIYKWNKCYLLPSTLRLVLALHLWQVLASLPPEVTNAPLTVLSTTTTCVMLHITTGMHVCLCLLYSDDLFCSANIYISFIRIPKLRYWNIHSDNRNSLPTCSGCQQLNKHFDIG